ncbi:acetolactate decarboxylase [Polaribacter sp. SA4-12]|uniref:acetolactate decarboxylase n=1 Tax=Polaribacter sp. SA4-12 TaxID=1312072 RepID=UPI003FA72C45
MWYAFVNKVFEGDLSVEKLKTKGNIGLGSYTKLDGELIMLDGVLERELKNTTVTNHFYKGSEIMVTNNKDIGVMFQEKI